MIFSVLALAAALSLSDTPEPGSATLLEQSQALRAEARTLAGAGDWTGAGEANSAALALQPGHYGLLVNGVIISANGGDLDGALDSLEALAGAGYALELAALGELEAALRAHDGARLSGIASQMAVNLERTGSAERYMRVPLRDALVETFAVDIDAERLYLGSVADASLYSVRLDDPQNPQRLAGPEDGLGSVFGMALDGRNRILYLATGRVEQSGANVAEDFETALVAFDLMTGEIARRYTYEGAGQFSDVVAIDGVIYASDSGRGRIYRLDQPGGTLELHAEDSRMASLQGLALAQGALWVLDYASGLWRVDPVTREASRVEVLEGSLIGFDGLTSDSFGELYAVRNGTQPHGLFHIALEPWGRGARVRPVLTGHPDFNEPTTVRVSDGRLFILANAQWSLFDPEDPDAAASRTDPVILYLPVP